jgi:hypothetical protein
VTSDSRRSPENGDGGIAGHEGHFSTVVSLITEGRSTDRNGNPFRRRRALPIVAVLAVLAVLGAVVWIKVFTTTEATTAAVSCNPPQPSSDPNAPAPAPLGTEVDPESLQDVQPAPLSATRVRVFNANGQGGQAAHIAAQLSDFGFASAPDVQVGNDPVYVDQNLQCQGQIRFGENGRAAAETVALVAPCSELIQDTRADDTVDLALGTYALADLQPNPDAQEVLRSLADTPQGAQPAPLDLDLLKAARVSRC